MKRDVSIRETMKTGITICAHYYGKIFMFIFIALVISALHSFISSYILPVSEVRTMSQTMVGYSMSILVALLKIRIYLAEFRLIGNIYADQEVSIRKAFTETSGKMKKVIGYAMLVVGIIGIPALPFTKMWFSIFTETNDVSTVSKGIAILMIIILCYRLSFVLNVIIFSNYHPIKHSFEITRKRWKYIVPIYISLLFIGSVLVFLPLVSAAWVGGISFWAELDIATTVGMFSASILGTFIFIGAIGLFIEPFLASIFVVTYLEVDTKENIYTKAIECEENAEKKGIDKI